MQRHHFFPKTKIFNLHKLLAYLRRTLKNHP
jgi:hypothetical protein